MATTSMASTTTHSADGARERDRLVASASRRFLSEVRNEMGRVTWPTQKEVYATTIVVILIVGRSSASISVRVDLRARQRWSAGSIGRSVRMSER